MTFLCYVRLNCKLYIDLTYESITSHYLMISPKNPKKKPDESHFLTRHVSKSVVQKYVMCYTISLYLFNIYKLQLKYILLLFSVIGMSLHYITPAICIICIFYTMLVCRKFCLMQENKYINNENNTKRIYCFVDLALQ